MAGSAKAFACANIAVVKYWGKLDEKLIIPYNPSISLTLDALRTVTTVSFDKRLKKDRVRIDGHLVSRKSQTYARVSHVLNIVRRLSKKTRLRANVVSDNNFPASSGLASSASGFAALARAASAAAELRLGRKELSIIARQGSGSACRSIYDGWVEWVAGRAGCSNSSYSMRIAPANRFAVCDVIAIISSAEKKTSSRTGMRISKKTSPLFLERVRIAKQHARACKKAILEEDFDALGRIAEADCALMHSVMLSSRPPLRYLSPASLVVCDEVRHMREEDGLPAYYTIDAGRNVHVLTLPKFSKSVRHRIKQLGVAESILISEPGPRATTMPDRAGEEEK